MKILLTGLGKPSIVHTEEPDGLRDSALHGFEHGRPTSHPLRLPCHPGRLEVLAVIMDVPHLRES